MTKAARKRHIRSAGTDGCPYCRADMEDLEYNDLSPVESGDIEQEVLCPACGRRWLDVFRLVEVHELFS